MLKPRPEFVYRQEIRGTFSIRGGPPRPNNGTTFTYDRKQFDWWRASWRRWGAEFYPDCTATFLVGRIDWEEEPE